MTENTIDESILKAKAPRKRIQENLSQKSIDSQEDIEEENITKQNIIKTTRQSLSDRNVRKRATRDHELEYDEFDLSNNDTNCALTDLVNMVREPGFEYHLALNNDEVIRKHMNRKFELVELDEPINHFNPQRKGGTDQSKYLTTGDIIVMKRDARYGQRDRMNLQKKTLNKFVDTMSNIHEKDPMNPLKPFSDF